MTVVFYWKPLRIYKKLCEIPFDVSCKTRCICSKEFIQFVSLFIVDIDFLEHWKIYVEFLLDELFDRRFIPWFLVQKLIRRKC